MIKEITKIDGMVYYNILNELIFFKLQTKEHNKWLLKTSRQKIQSLVDRGLL